MRREVVSQQVRDILQIAFPSPPICTEWETALLNKLGSSLDGGAYADLGARRGESKDRD